MTTSQPGLPEKPSRREKRAEIRADLIANFPRWYNPALHLATLCLVTVAMLLVAVGGLRNLRGWELLAIPATWLIFNPIEWTIHHDLDIGQRWFFLKRAVYDHHTPEHHIVFADDDMSIQDQREIGLILTKSYGLFLFYLVVVAPPSAFIWILGLHNPALLYFATMTLCVMSYELLHLASHLPETSWLARTELIQFVKRNHTIHHDPRLKLGCNFNTLFPLTDWLLGTYIADPTQALAARQDRLARQP
ncbi:MAG TPA: hypothetical protein VMU16_02285 [Candidatus Binataceae bacterium]|nr:hypothetical protein [Candidatus Binataceae bacterium]